MLRAGIEYKSLGMCQVEVSSTPCACVVRTRAFYDPALVAPPATPHFMGKDVGLAAELEDLKSITIKRFTVKACSQSTK